MAKLCFIEDDDFLRRTLEAGLIRAGHKVVLVENGSDALTTIKKTRPELILLDLILPGKNGFEILAELRKLKGAIGKIPVLVISKLSSQGDVERAKSLGANYYIKKIDKNIRETLNIIDELLKKKPI